MKVITLNTGHADWGYDLESWSVRAVNLAASIKALDPDIVFLQEMFFIDYASADNKLKTYMASKGLPAADFDKLGLLIPHLSSYQHTASLIPSKDRKVPQPGLFWGLAILSKTSLTATQTIELSYSDFDRWPRILQIAQVSIEGKDCRLFNLHLAAESQTARHKTALEVAKQILNGDHQYAIAAGDLNETQATGPAMQFRVLMKESFEAAAKKIVTLDGNLVDKHSNAFRAFSDSRIDYIFTGNSFSIESSQYEYSIKIPFYSDHPMAIAELK